ncbi:MAG: SUMF1/EgtB/PvdO family nonheme iron enzyme [Deltaproteobacteria bacterium]|nr:SUMF1/EgtB/PvdO family nonheme iron enzyme [Deltaproteobacteria bacterium]
MSYRHSTHRMVPLGAALVVTLAITASASGDKTGPTGQACFDRDGDGFGEGCARGPDCDDGDRLRNPDAVDACDFVDNNCDLVVDEGCPVAPLERGARVDVPAGDLVMGSDPGEGSRDERPEHMVFVDTFKVDKYEVTNGRYAQCVKTGACTPPQPLSSRFRSAYYGDPRFADYPVINVDWYQAAAFCRSIGGRLPTEAEWEKSARGGAPSERVYPWGDERPDCSKANFGGLAGCIGDTDRVGRRPAGASPYGALDLAGNVWEWVSDWYDSRYYAVSPRDNPEGPEWGSFKVIRGGCFEQGPDNLRASCRANTLPTSRSPNIGFRCAWD